MTFNELPVEMKDEIINKLLPSNLNHETKDTIDKTIRDLYHVSLVNFELYSLSKLKLEKFKTQIFVYLKNFYRYDIPCMPKILEIGDHHFVFDQESQYFCLNEAGSMLLDALSQIDFTNELNDHIHYLM